MALQPDTWWEPDSLSPKQKYHLELLWLHLIIAGPQGLEAARIGLMETLGSESVRGALTPP